MWEDGGYACLHNLDVVLLHRKVCILRGNDILRDGYVRILGMGIKTETIADGR